MIDHPAGVILVWFGIALPCLVFTIALHQLTAGRRSQTPAQIAAQNDRPLLSQKQAPRSPKV